MFELKKLEWDSKHIGLNCGLLDCSTILMNDDKTLFNSIIKQIKCNPKISFTTIKLPIFYPRTLNRLIQFGAIFIDIELRFKAGNYSRKNIANPKTVIFSDTTNAEPFVGLAKEMRYSRLYQDPRLSKTKIEKLWEKSIINQCSGFTQKIAVAYRDKQPVGLTTLKYSNKNTINLFMVGVLKPYQGLGIGKQLLYAILHKFRISQTIFVDTSSKNIAAQNLYQQTGFQLNSMFFILHFINLDIQQ